MPAAKPPLDEHALARIEAEIAGSGMSRWLHLSAARDGDGITYRLGFTEEHIGNPVLRALHGGVVSAFLESCARLELMARLPDTARLRVTSVHTSYLRSSKAQDMFARIDVQRAGRRFGFLEATGWQDGADNPVARAAIGIRIVRADTQETD